MHESVMDWTAHWVAEWGLQTKKVLEIGSANVNGGVRPLFSGEYVGIDFDAEAEGVDVVMSSHEIGGHFGEDSFDVVLCLEMLEHDPLPIVTMQEIGKVLRPGGAFIITTRGNGFKEHNRPDLWRFMRDGMELLIDMIGPTTRKIQQDPQAAGWLVAGQLGG